MEISITRALNELTLLDKRITDCIKDSRFVGFSKKADDKIFVTYTRDEFDNLIKGNFARVNDLIKRRTEIKAKIVESNAKVIVSIAGKEYTVASAIEEKNLIQYKKQLLTKLKSQYNEAVATVNIENEKVSDKIYKMISTINSTGDKKIEINGDDDSYLKYFKNTNEYELINPLNIHEIIITLKKEIEDFENEVDFVLSESNAINKITVSE